MESLLKRIERNRREHDRLIALILCLSLIVSMGTFAVFHKKAVAKTYIRQVLDCPLAAEGAGLVVHTHNDDCYDENHNLVCTLPELEAHTHSDACYTEVPVQVCGLAESVGHVHGSDCRTLMLTCEEEEREATLDEEGNAADAGHVHTPDCYSEVLSCGMEEGDGAHTHTDACYETEYLLTCDKPEVLPHVHTDDCYQKNEDGSIYVDENGYSWLICGLPEVVQHVHGPECFTVYELDDGEPEEAEEDEETTDTTDTTDTEDMTVPALPMPAQSWERTAGGIKVSVEAPEGAFPENTRIAVTPVNGSSLMDTVSDAVNGEVLEVQAVDITFFDAEGHEIEPVIPIRVVMTPAATEHAEEKTNVVHVDITQQTAELIEQAAGTEFDNSEVVFDAEAFTIYAIVYTVDFEYGVNGKLFSSSMPGAEDMPLSEIVKGLGIVGEEELETFLSKITSVTSTNEEVAVVTEERSVRVLKDGDAQIVITMQDGAAFSISVEAEGVTEISDENEVATVSTVNDLYLPAAGEVKAELLTEEQSETVISVVQTATEIDESSAATYQAFSIALENVDVTAYDGFDVAVTLPEDAVVGRDFQLYQVREDGTATDLTESLTVTSVPNDNGLQNVSGIRFKTEDFADFVLSYSIETYYTTAGGDTYRITLNYGPKAGIPEGAELQVEEILPEDESYTDYLNESAAKLGVDSGDVSFARFFDIEIQKDGEKIEPKAPVQVTISLTDAPEEAVPEDLRILHFAPAGLETIDETKAEQKEDATIALSFEANGFSVYGVVYTVDFHWKVNGKTYDFSIPGGGFISLEHLIEALGIQVGDADGINSITEEFGEDAESSAESAIEENKAAQAAASEISSDDENGDVDADAAYEQAIHLNNIPVSEETRTFVEDIETVEFSSPELVWVGKVDVESTVGALKEVNELEIEYSASLTEEQIAEINAQTVEAGDWALISIKPFDTEETLTVTMKNGEVFAIRVTDAQISTNVLTADGKTYRITVTYDEDAEIPAGTKLTAEEIETGTDEYLQHLGRAWTEVNSKYLEKEQRLRINNDDLDDDMDEDIHPVNLDHIRFFDIRLEINGEEIEPKAPVKVEIQYVDGFPVSETENPETGVIHFRKEDIELIKEVETEEDLEGNLTGFLYMQDSFSDIGTYVGQETKDDPAASVSGRIAYPKLSAMLRASSGSLKDELGEPVASKTLEDNEDGTYTLSLSVTGAARKKDEQPKANILFVMDRSSSMSNHNNDIYLPYNGAHQSGVTYYGTNDGKNYFTLNYWNGQYTYTDSTRPYTTHTYRGTVYTRISRLKAEQEAMSILFTDLLENNKDENGSYTKDTVEISVISFADDRGKMSEGTEYPSGGSNNGWTSSDYTGLMTVVNNNNTPSGTNWQDALKYAKEVADAKKAAQPDEPVFVVFLTDGEPTAVYGESGGAHHYNNVGGGFIAAYTPARPDAKALVDAGYGFYSIFTFNPGEEQTRYLKRLVHYAYTGYDASDTTSGDFSYLDSSQYVNRYFYNADSPENLASAFDDILSAITTIIAHGNVSIVDGLTTDAMTSTLIDGKANGFTYKVTDENNNILYTVTATGETDHPSVTFTINGTTYSGSQVVQKQTSDGKKYYSVTVDGKEYKMALADFADTGEGAEETKELTWDLSPIGTLADKCTYSIEFVVWPNQDAYDYVAALNNGLNNWDETTQTPVYDKNGELKYYKNGVKDYPSIVLDPNTGIYEVLTNTKQELEYSVISTTNGVETTEGPYQVDLDLPDPMDLKATASALEKVWNLTRDPSILYKYLYESQDEEGNPVAYDIGFVIKRDGEEYRQVHLPGEATVTDDGVSYDWSAYDSDDLVTYNGKTFSKRWSQDFSISTGLMLSTAQMEARDLDKNQYTSYSYGGKQYYVLEGGHDFQIGEPLVGYEFDFEAPIYHPMLVDGVLMNVNFSTESGSKQIIGMEALEIDTGTGKSALSVFNTLRGYINLKKIVVDQGGTSMETDNTKFVFNVELTNPLPVFEGDSIPWYGINGLYYHDAEGNYYQAEYINGNLQVTTEEGGPYPASGTAFNPDNVGAQTVTYTVNGEEKTVTISGNQMTPSEGSTEDGYKKATTVAMITQTEMLFIANVPVNTQYSIQEIARDGFQLVDIEQKIGSGTAASAGSIETGIITGEIVQNTETLVTYTNKCLVTDITIQKTDGEGNGLAGAVFQLKKVGDGGHSESMATEIGSVGGLSTITKTVNGETRTYASAFESNGGVQTITGLPDGTYRLYEVYFPAGYVSTYKYIQFEIQDRVMKNVTTDTGNTSKLDTTVNGINLKISNVPGVALPNTGGNGTGIFTLIGGILSATAGAILTLTSCRRRKKQYT